MLIIYNQERFIYGSLNKSKCELIGIEECIIIPNNFMSCSECQTIDFRGMINVKYIGSNFCYNSKVNTVYLPYVNNIFTIGNNFLYFCTNLTLININVLKNVYKVGYGFMYYCSSLTCNDYDNVKHMVRVFKMRNFIVDSYSI